jgi:ribose 5-phosphate isomerase A
MKVASANQEDKRACGESAAALVEDGMVVGLGTGSTVAWTIRKLGLEVSQGMKILGVPTSYQSESLAIECGITLTTLSQHPVLDLAIDGADQVNLDLIAIKGGGAAHTREKVVSSSAKRFVLVVDGTKYLDPLSYPVPLEVLPFASKLVLRKVADLGGNPILRQAKMKDGPVITDNGNFVVDVDFGEIKNPADLASRLSSIPGIVEHGIFCKVDEVHIARSGSIEVVKRRH